MPHICQVYTHLPSSTDITEKSLRVKRTDTLVHVTDRVYVQWCDVLPGVTRERVRLRAYIAGLKQIGEAHAAY